MHNIIGIIVSTEIYEQSEAIIKNVAVKRTWKKKKGGMEEMRRTRRT